MPQFQTRRRRLASAGGGFTPYTEVYNGGVGTSTVPAGAVQLVITCIGAGGGGSRKNAPFTANGGGGAGYALKTIVITGPDAGKVLPWAVGMRGQGANTNGGSGSTGGTAEINTGVLVNSAGIVAASGGGGGTNTTPGAAGTAANGDVNTFGQPGSVTNGGQSGDPDGGAPGSYEGGPGGEWGGGGGPGPYVSGDAIQYNGGSGGFGVLRLAWT